MIESTLSVVAIVEAVKRLTKLNGIATVALAVVAGIVLAWVQQADLVVGGLTGLVAVGTHTIASTVSSK